MKAIIIARVSTEEQRDAGNLLQAQVERMNVLPAAVRHETSAYLQLVSESSFYEFKNKGMDARELLEFCAVYREGGARQEALFKK